MHPKLIDDGDILLNDNNFIFTDSGHYVHNAIHAYGGYFVTNGTGIIGKEGLGNNGTLTFPAGICNYGKYGQCMLTA